ncbi:syntaxin-19 isoform X2 [Cavia porcellus]|uniref:syntaxin-19 isoform X2 n=1 Tax=Cavia porcellus TaxID=10141 RepID=UPI002FE421D0
MRTYRNQPVTCKTEIYIIDQTLQQMILKFSLRQDSNTTVEKQPKEQDRKIVSLCSSGWLSAHFAAQACLALQQSCYFNLLNAGIKAVKKSYDSDFSRKTSNL